MDRRSFLEKLAALGIALQVAPPPPRRGWQRQRWRRTRSEEASYYTKGNNDTVVCTLCPHREVLKPGETGKCRTRRNIDGELRTLAVGDPCVVNLDPVEKNPLAHVLPGAEVMAVAHAGCNLRCQYCQNWQFSQRGPDETENLDFEQAEAFSLAREKELAGISFTYTEGVCHIEFNLRLAAAARQLGLKALLCTGGFVAEEPLRDFLAELDAVTVTVKGFTERFYERYIGAPSPRPVLESCLEVKRSERWLEIATLVCPNLNDGEAELRGIARFIRRYLGADTPWHIERFTPKYKMLNRAQTPVATMEKARQIGLEEGLRHVYICNVAPHDGNHTYCPRCEEPVIRRLGFRTLRNDLEDGRCPACGTPVAGVWDA